MKIGQTVRKRPIRGPCQDKGTLIIQRTIKTINPRKEGRQHTPPEHWWLSKKIAVSPNYRNPKISHHQDLNIMLVRYL